MCHWSSERYYKANLLSLGAFTVASVLERICKKNPVPEIPKDFVGRHFGAGINPC